MEEVREATKEVWCQIEPGENHAPWDLEDCREMCQKCKVKDNCVHWIDLN